MDIRSRLKRIEDELQEGVINIYLEDGSKIKRDKKEMLDFIITGIDCNIYEKEPGPEYEFLAKVDENDTRNNKSIILAKKMIQNRDVSHVEAD